MKAVEFCYWLQGLFEVGEPTELNAKQTDLIKRHLNMVFAHEIDQSYPAEQQDKLNKLHHGPIPPNQSKKKNFMGMTDEEYEQAGRPRC